MSNFKKFTAVSQRSENRITVTGSNAFGLPTKFFKDNNVGNFKYVVLYYDDQEKAVGFLFTNDENEQYKFSIIKSKRGYGGSVIATSFFKSNDIVSKDYKDRYKWEIQEIEGIGKLFVIKLVNKQQESSASENVNLQ